MKKVLSVFLAVLMVFSCMAMTVNAADDDTTPAKGPYGITTGQQCAFKFKLNGGTVKNTQYVYSETAGTSVETDAKDVPDIFVVGPRTANEFKVGHEVTLPSVEPPKGYAFVGWKRVPHMDGDKEIGPFTTVPGGYTIKQNDIDYGLVEFSAQYEEGQPEEDTFAKVFEILIKVFGTIIGLIAYNNNPEKGQAFMRELLGSITG